MKNTVLNLSLSLLFCLGFSACNKEEYFEKEFLAIEGTTNGSVDSGETDGADGGVAGGGASTGGGVDGSTSAGGAAGGTSGGVAGGTSGGAAGGTSGGVVRESATENFRQAAQVTKKLDIVWIIDDSGSMKEEQAALGSNFSIFIDDFITKNVDFKMAVTTTDTSSAAKKGKIFMASDLKLTSALAQANPTQFKLDFKNLVKVGLAGSGSEQGLAASEGFMEKYAASFIRPEAYLAIVIVSDEEDQSAKLVAAYTDYLKSFKSSPGLVKVYSVVDVNNTNSGQGITVGGEKYKQASNNTSGLIADIRGDFHNSLNDMGLSIINLLDSFALAREPFAGSLKVFVNNVETVNFSYDAASHSIKFNQNSLPPVGAEIRVTYLK